jgi:peroxiredoxin
MLALGESAPPFALKGVDGQVHTLADYDGADVLVLIQACNHCPYVQASEENFRSLQAEYAPQGVRVVAINSNDPAMQPEDAFEEMVARAEQEGFNYDYLHDEDQSLARALGATRTPEVFVFDRNRRLVYHGAPTSSLLDHQSANVEGDDELRDYLRDAVAAALGGRSPETTETPLLGCSVKSEYLELLRDPIRFVWREPSTAA